MTKKELCDIVKISRPTLNSKLLSKEQDIYLFALSFEKWEAKERILKFKEYLANQESKK